MSASSAMKASSSVPMAITRRIVHIQTQCSCRQTPSFRQIRTNTTFGPTRVPPIRERLKPLIPFFIKWSIITSLAVHLLRIRIRSREELGRSAAQASVLEAMIERVRRGEELEEEEIRRDMEMVGLRERTALTRDEVGLLRDTADVGWMETLFGIKRRRKDAAEDDANAVNEWAEIIREATSPEARTSLPTSSADTARAERRGSARRAPSASVYL